MIQYSQLVVSLVAVDSSAISIVTGIRESIWILFGAATDSRFLLVVHDAGTSGDHSSTGAGEREMTNAIALNASGMALMTLSGPGLGGLGIFLAFGPASYVFRDGRADVCGVPADDKGQRWSVPDAAKPGRRRENMSSVPILGRAEVTPMRAIKTIFVLLLADAWRRR